MKRPINAKSLFWQAFANRQWWISRDGWRTEINGIELALLLFLFIIFDYMPFQIKRVIKRIEYKIEKWNDYRKGKRRRI